MEAVSENLALFKPLPQDYGVESLKWIEYRPTGQLTAGAPITFSIPPSPMYIDLKRSRLHVKCKILKGDGSNLPEVPVGTSIPEEVKVGPTNNLLGSLWSQIDVSLQQQVITSSVGTNYPYKALLDTLLTYGYDEKDNQLAAQMFVKDNMVGGSSNDPMYGMNPGFSVRSGYFQQSKNVDMEGPIFMDICQQERLILDGIPIDIKLYPKAETFVLISSNPSPSYKIEITDAVLKVCMVHVSPGIVMGHSRALESTPARYFFHRSDIKTFAIPQGQYGLTVEDVFQGSCPERAVVGLVSSAAYNGSYATNPFEFKHYECNFAAFYLDGQSVPGRPLQPNFEADNYVEAYLTLFTGTGMYQAEKSNNISRKDYKHGYSLYVFEIGGGQQDQNNQSEPRKGNTRLEIKFAAALTESATLIMYAKFPAVMEIDRSRRVTVS